MSDIAIHCEGLSKQYRIGERESYQALRDVITDAASAPFRRLREAISNGNGWGIRKAESAARNSFWALDGVSFEVKRGEVVGVIGRNGAGKSTLLKILSRITKPTRGHAEIHGRVGSLLEVGTGFHPELTGRENIYLNGAILGMGKSEIERKFDEMVAFAEVERFIDTPVKRYSSGMYVRLAFAVAAHLEPEILIVDEVLAVGDAAFQKKCLGKMGEAANRGRTVLLVSHNMGAIRSLCSEVIWLNEGKTMAEGPSASVVDQYLSTVLRRNGTSIDVRNSQRAAGHGERLRITSIQFNGGDIIKHGEPLRARIEFETASEIHHAAFVFGFCSFEGIRVMTVDSDLVEAQRDVRKNRIGVVEAIIPELQLQPGRYALDLGARSGNTNTLDVLMGCAQIEVLPGATTPPMIMKPIGGMRIPATWRWNDSDRISEQTSND